MGAFDFLLQQMEERFGISSASASSLMSGLVSLIQGQAGGLSGFLDRFKQAGFGDITASWLGGATTPRAISADGLQSVLGSTTISNLATKAGLPVTTAASGLAFLLPNLIQKLTPGGVIPSRLPSDFLSYLSGGASAVASGARQAVEATERSGIMRLVWPLAILVILGILGLSLWRGLAAKFHPAEQVRLASQKATVALAALKPG